MLDVAGRVVTGLVVEVAAVEALAADAVSGAGTVDGAVVAVGSTTVVVVGGEAVIVEIAEGNEAPTDLPSARSRTTNAAPTRITTAAKPTNTPIIARDRRGGGGRLDSAGIVSEFCGVTRRSAVEGVWRDCEIRSPGGTDPAPLGGTETRLVRPVEIRAARSAWSTPSGDANGASSTASSPTPAGRSSTFFSRQR